MYRVILAFVFVSIALLGCGREPRSTQVSNGRKANLEKATRDKQPHALKKRIAEENTVSSSRSTDTEQPELKWSRAIRKKVLSPDGKSLAIWDSQGVYLADATGERATKLKIEPGSVGENTDISLAYNPQSTRLAVLTKSSGGEPGICENDQLYWVDVKSRKVQPIGQWDECIQGNGEAIVNRELLGWSTDGNSVRMQAEVWRGEGMPGVDNAINKGMRSVSFDVTRPKTWNRDALTSHLSW